MHSQESNGHAMLAVDGHEIYFHYHRKKESAILNSVNIAVNQGAIYSLLGPSACGKTTLLKCIIGQLKPQRGSLKVYGRHPGSEGFFIPGRGVGYMPQDLALYNEMTTEEILMYFGSLYGMRMKDIEERIDFLVELLELPKKRKHIQHFSGGQQRRVSFAIALIHKPPLLVLDEPTVGVDPLLRKSIWDHLVDLAENDHSTVIITTHYAEEARQAHIVGFMKNGHLLVQRNPEILIKTCGGVSLEDVFLKVCRNKGNDDDEEDHETNIDELMLDGEISAKYVNTNGVVWSDGAGEPFGSMLKCDSTSERTFELKNLRHNTMALLPFPPVPTEIHNDSFYGTSSWRRLYYLTKKNFLRLRRNIPLALFLICLTTCVMTLFFLCVSSDPFDLKMAVVNEETGEEGLNKFGEILLNSISNHTIDKETFPNLTSALESIKQEESCAVLHIGSEFSECLLDRILEGVYASNDTIQCSRIKLILDMSNYINAMTVYKSILESFQVFVKDVLVSVGTNPAVGEMVLQVEKYTEGLKPSTFGEFLTPPIVICTTYISSIALTAMTLIAERKFGLMSRTLVVGATTTEVLLSFFFGLLVMLLLQVVTIIVVTFYGFSAPCHGSIFWVIVACIFTGICGMSFGLILSAAIDDECIATLVGTGTFFPTQMISAMFWPLEAMPYYIRYISNCLPLTRIIASTRSVMIQGRSITDNYVWDGYLICFSWIVAQIILAIVVLKIRK